LGIANRHYPTLICQSDSIKIPRTREWKRLNPGLYAEDCRILTTRPRKWFDLLMSFDAGGGAVG